MFSCFKNKNIFDTDKLTTKKCVSKGGKHGLVNLLFYLNPICDKQELFKSIDIEKRDFYMIYYNDDIIGSYKIDSDDEIESFKILPEYERKNIKLWLQVRICDNK